MDEIRTRFTVLGATLCAVALLAAAPAAAAEDGDVPRTVSGRPDLTGTYDIAALTPLERDEKFSDNLYLSPEEAEEIANAVATRRADALEASDPTREAPPPGGDGSPGAAGNVGGYNDFWLDYGSRSIALDGKFRTSLVFDPPNGRLPKMKPAARQARMAFFSLFRKNTLNYNFTVEDPNTWESAWSGEFPWPTAGGRVYEYACHEGNYAMGNIMRGARLLEADAAGEATGGE